MQVQPKHPVWNVCLQMCPDEETRAPLRPQTAEYHRAALELFILYQVERCSNER